jgi:putative transposase
MPKNGHTEEQILHALHQAEAGTNVSEICREHGIGGAIFYILKEKYSALGLSELSEFRQLREENAKSSSGWQRISHWTDTSCKRSCKKSCKALIAGASWDSELRRCMRSARSGRQGRASR